MMTVALKSALRTLGVMITLGAAQAYSSGLGEDFVWPAEDVFIMNSAPSHSQSNTTADGVSEAPRDEVEEDPTHAGDSDQNAEDTATPLRARAEWVNERGRDGTPLMRAAWDGDEARVRWLIKRGADVNHRNNIDAWGRTILHRAAEQGHEGIVRLLVQELEVDVNQLDKYGQTALHFAAERGHEGIVRLLVQKGIDVNQLDSVQGNTALHHAAQRGCEKVVRLLVGELEIDVNQRGGNGHTALHCAAATGREGVVRLLVNEFHVDLNQFDNNGETPLHYVITYNQEAIVHLLLEELHVNVNQLTADGRLPIGIAVLQGHLVLVQYLHRRGAQLTQADGRNRTPLDYAVLEGHPEIIDWIITTLIRIEFINQLRSGNRADWRGQILTRYGQVFWDQLLGAEGLEFLNQILARKIPDGLSEILNEAQLDTLKQDLKGKHTTLLEGFLAQIQTEFDVGPLVKLELAVEGGREIVVRYLIEELGVFLDPFAPETWVFFYKLILESIVKAAQLRQQFPDQDILYNKSGAIVSYLASKLKDHVNTPGADNRTPLQRVLDLEEGHLLLVRFLIELGADITRLAVDPRSSKIWKLFYKAILHKADKEAEFQRIVPAPWIEDESILIFNYLASALIPFINEPGDDGLLPLTRARALEEGFRVTVIHFLKQWGAQEADVNQLNADGHTPLQAAAIVGNVEVVRLLLEAGAHPSAVFEGMPPLHIAAMNGVRPIVELLVRAGVDIHQAHGSDQLTPLGYAIRERHIPLIEYLLGAGVDINGPYGLEQRTPLMHAAGAGPQYGQVVAFLLQQPGIDIHWRSAQGQTALQIAADTRNVYAEVGRLLVRAGAPLESIQGTRLYSWLRFQFQNNGDEATEAPPDEL